MLTAKKAVIMFAFSTFVNLYTTFVLQSLWNWFAVEALSAPHVSYWVMYGLLMILNLVFYKPEFEDEHRWKWLEIVLVPCIPSEKRDEVVEELKQQKEELTVQLGIMIFSTAFGSTITLALGWGIHTFLV